MRHVKLIYHTTGWPPLHKNNEIALDSKFGNEFKFRLRLRLSYRFVDVLEFVLVPRFIKSTNFLMLMLIKARWTDRYE